MTKKDFIALAQSLRESKPPRDAFEPSLQWERDRDAIATVCANSNPRFNRSRWLSYINGECGPNGGTIKN